MEFSEVGVVDELGSLSNYHGNSNENLTQKTSFTFLKLLRYYPELSGSWICEDGVQVQTEQEEFTVCSRSP